MARSRPSKAEVERLLDVPGKRVAGFYKWTEKANVVWVSVDLPVNLPTDETRELRIAVNVALHDTRRTFLLLLDDHRVRALCIDGSHTNRVGNTDVWHCQTHKHTWRDDCGDRHAYTPTDITATNVQGLLEQFCQECNITCEAQLDTLPPIQGAIINDV
jgi:hypothetical protein